MDDLITGVNDVKEGRKVVQEMTDLLQSTSFTLKKWNSNHKDILQDLDDDNVASAVREISSRDCSSGACSDGVQKALGLVWNTNTDELFLKKPNWEINGSKPLTMRLVLSHNHRIFDPLSMWAPLYIRMNVCCFKIMRRATDWDEVLADDLADEW